MGHDLKSIYKIKMTNIWKNFPSDKLQKLIGESQLKNISEILPLINNEEFNENQIYKKNTLARIFEAFSGADKLLKKKFREDLYGSLNNDDKFRLLKVLDLNTSDISSGIIKASSIPWKKSSETIKICDLLSISLDLLPYEIDEPPANILLEPQEKILGSFKQLKDYQFPVVAKSQEKLNIPRSRFIIQMPTGSGKTRTAMEIISNYINNSDDDCICVWLAHSSELLDQAYQCFLEVWGHISKKKLEIHRVWGKNEMPKSLYKNSFILGGFQKMHSVFKNNPNAFNHFKDKTKLIIVDEAHRVLADTYKLVTLSLRGEDTKIIGLTATPGRSSKDLDENISLSEFFFSKMVGIDCEGYNSPIHYLKHIKVLAEAHYEHIVTNINISLTPKQKEHFSQFFDLPKDVLDSLSNNNIRNIEIIRKLQKECERKDAKIIFFACSIKHSKEICAFLTLLGIKAAHVDGSASSLNRKNIIEKFINGDLQVICNYELFSTGFDAPKIDTVFIARPTFSIVLYAQMIGRGLRGPEIGGSAKCKIIDVKDNISGFSNHDFVYTYFDEYFDNL